MNSYAGIFRRITAYIIDVLAVTLILTPLWVWFLIGLFGPQSGAYLLGYAMFLPLIWTGARCFYLVLFWYHRGATPGMQLLGLSVAGIEEGELLMKTAILRYVAFLVSTLLWGIGFLPALFTARRQTVPDLVA